MSGLAGQARNVERMSGIGTQDGFIRQTRVIVVFFYKMSKKAAPQTARAPSKFPEIGLERVAMNLDFFTHISP